MSERSLGDRWVETRTAEGAWVCKLPASTTSGIPDWLVLHGGAELWEAKLALEAGEWAYTPNQLRASQRFFQRMLARYAPDTGGVLLLSVGGWMQLPAGRAMKGPLRMAHFIRHRRPYV